MKDLEMKELVITALDDLKAVDVQCIDVADKTDITDFMVIASGTSSRHVKSLASNVISDAKQANVQPIGVEGMDQGEWVLVDLNAVVVHVMLPQVRDFYDIESLWDAGMQKKEDGQLIEH